MFEQIASDEETLAILCFSIVGIVAIVVFGGGMTIVNILKVISNSRLKLRMLDRGMDASEIEKVLKAGTDEFRTKWHTNNGHAPPKRPLPDKARI